MIQHVIWSNSPDAIEDIARDMMSCNDGLEWDEAVEQAEEVNADYLLDEEINLNIEVGDDIVVIGRLGLWDGQKTGWKLLHTQNIGDCLRTTCGDQVTWYVDERGDLCCDDAHHDGTNHLTFRAWKSGVSVERQLRFLDKIAWGTVTRRDITNCTRRLGEYVADVYGWNKKGRKLA